MILQYINLQMAMCSVQAAGRWDQPAPTRAYRDISSPEYPEGLANSWVQPLDGMDQHRYARVSSISFH